MGFIWVQDITPGAVIDAVDAIEIRTNVDIVDDEKCAAEKVTDQATNYPGYCNDEHTGYLSNDHGTYQSGYDIGVDSTNYPGYYNDQNTSYNNGQLDFVRTTNDWNALNDENTGYNNADKVGVDATNHPGLCSDEHTNYESGDLLFENDYEFFTYKDREDFTVT